MPQAVLVTCNRWPELSDSDRLYADALAARGVGVGAAPWNGAQAPFAGADLVVLRSNWDYHYTPAAFQAWLDGLARPGVALFNPPDLVRWNLDKRYLLELAARGVPIPRTYVVANVDASPAQLLAAAGWRRAVLKPAIGASGHQVRLIAALTDAWPDEPTAARPLLLQEYLPEVASAGELSCVFFAGVYSHTFCRRPQSGEFRVNSQFAGAVVRAAPEPAVIAQARSVLALLPRVPLYARVDGVVRAGVFVLMELELNEPSLRLDLDPPAAGRFADATLALLDVQRGEDAAAR